MHHINELKNGEEEERDERSEKKFRRTKQPTAKKTKFHKKESR